MFKKIINFQSYELIITNSPSQIDEENSPFRNFPMSFTYDENPFKDIPEA